MTAQEILNTFTDRQFEAFYNVINDIVNRTYNATKEDYEVLNTLNHDQWHVYNYYRAAASAFRRKNHGNR